MKYSIISVSKDYGNGTVEGYWLQDVTGSLDKAIGRAYGIHLANSCKIHLAIVPQINSTVPALGHHTNLKKLNHNALRRNN